MDFMTRLTDFTPARPVLMAIAVIVIAMTIAPAPVCAAEGTSKIPADAEGLVRVNVEGVDRVYARPGADLSLYGKVMLDPIEVSFRKDWNPKPGGSPVSAAEKQDIRDGLARVLRKAFTRELAQSGRYEVVTLPSDGVLRIKAEIRDLYINAPDVPRPGMIRSYTLSVGEMTLIAELRDAPTGDLVARVIDHKHDPESVFLELTTKVDNVAAAERAAALWARVLREQLDAAHRAVH
jgi:Protein of unknown function (DUF3313)